MEIKNVLAHKTVVIPDIFKNKIELRFKCELTDDELVGFAYVLKFCEKILLKDGFSNSDLTRVSVLFIDDEKIEMTENDPLCCGSHFSLIVYNMNRIRRLKNFMKTMTVFTEELVHHYWRIEDEHLVKHKDIEILKLGNPVFSLELFKEWGIYDF